MNDNDLNIFIDEIFEPALDSRISLKEIYEKYREWYANKYGIIECNKLKKQNIYNILKRNINYPFHRYKTGYYLTGLHYKSAQQLKLIIIDDLPPPPLYFNNFKVNMPDRPVPPIGKKPLLKS